MTKAPPGTLPERGLFTSGPLSYCSARGSSAISKPSIGVSMP